VIAAFVSALTAPAGLAACDATHFAISAPASVSAGSAFDFTVTAEGLGNCIATSYAGTMHFTANDALATLPADATLSSGIGTFSATLTTAGGRLLTATDTTTSSITGTSNVIIVTAAAATHFGLSAPTEAAVGNPFHFTVTALDQFNNRATSYGGTIIFGSSDTAASLPPHSKLTAGVGVFTATMNTVGSQGLEACDTVSVFVCGMASSIMVGPAETHFTVIGPSAVNAGTPFHLTVTARDGHGHVVPGYTGTVHFTSTDHLATLPANARLTGGIGTFTATLRTAGKQRITATDAAKSSIKGTSNAIGVAPGQAVRFEVAAPPSIRRGHEFGFKVVARDRFGNVATAYTGTVQFLSSDPHARLPHRSVLIHGVNTFVAVLETHGLQTITAEDSKHHSLSGTAHVRVRR
jgi:hypothetical protein